ncbi:hypothetical protein FRC09_015984 [Ceratobasidium sp. 395]|nr:hypothetical protein FRC09_015984 [Ceratobasidium sp. 395]
MAETHERMAAAATVQYNMLTKLIEHYKSKYGSAKVMIVRLQAEVKALQQQLSTQNYQPAVRLPPDQGPIHDSGYSSGHSGGSKRRRIDSATGYHVGQGSSPRSTHTPSLPSVFAPPSVTRGPITGGGTSLMSDMDHRGAAGQRQGEAQMRNLNAQQYTYIPPSTPMNRQMPARSTQAQPRGSFVSGSNQQQLPRSAAMMPPPSLQSRQFGSTSAVQAAAPSFTGVGQNTARAGQSKSSGKYDQDLER